MDGGSQKPLVCGPLLPSPFGERLVSEPRSGALGSGLSGALALGELMSLCLSGWRPGGTGRLALGVPTVAGLCPCCPGNCQVPCPQ